VVGDERVGARLVNVVYVSAPPNEFYRQSGTTQGLDGATLTVTSVWAALDLATVKITAAARIDAEAEAARAKHITLGSGQALTYWQKLAEAKAFLGNPVYRADDYPLLTASAVWPGTVAQTAQIIVDAAARWSVASAMIEGRRLQVKSAVASAPTIDDVAVVLSSMEWTQRTP
jgi:hypothetical protein